MKSTRTYNVLGLTDDLKDKNFGSFKTKKAAEAVVFKNIKKFKEFGMGIVERVPWISRQWNYTIDAKGTVWARQNHGDLW